MEDALKYSPAAAVPVSTKMPDPITAPIPSAVSDQGPRVFSEALAGRFGFRDQLVDGLTAENLFVGSTDDGSGFRGL